ncbi:protein-export chaperone SecB [Candidatus Pelagibacter sp.]|nr:protein-export chaperone SecB [Candidatus Pelagibacter sp.]
MEKKYRILGEFIKDISAKTKDVESYIYTKENISKFKLFIDISTNPLKNKMAEVSITTKFKEADDNQKNSYFEMIYAVIVKIDEDVNTKEVLEPIFLQEVPAEVYPKIEKIFLDLLNHSGYTNVKFESKVDFNELYKKRGN